MDIMKSEIREKKLIVLISLDIEGAFDNAWRPAIKCRLAESNCPANLRRLIDSYLCDMKVRVTYAGAEYCRETTKGCVQGSKGGPTLWNMLLDPLLKELGSGGEHVQAFADDIVLMFSGSKALEIQRHANDSLACAWNWGKKNKLKFSQRKKVR